MKFVGTVTDKSFVAAIENLHGVSNYDRRRMLLDTRDHEDVDVAEAFFMLKKVAIWQSRRYYFDENNFTS